MPVIILVSSTFNSSEKVSYSTMTSLVVLNLQYSNFQIKEAYKTQINERLHIPDCGGKSSVIYLCKMKTTSIHFGHSKPSKKIICVFSCKKEIC